MELHIKVQFTCPKYAESLGLVGYNSNIIAEQESFGMNDFEKQAYALRIINDEFGKVIGKVNERLLAEGFGKESLRKPLMGVDDYGRSIDLNVP